MCKWPQKKILFDIKNIIPTETNIKTRTIYQQIQ